jgi:hypothetical protein
MKQCETFAFKTESLTVAIKYSHSLTKKYSVWNEPIKEFFSQLFLLLFGGK